MTVTAGVVVAARIGKSNGNTLCNVERAIMDVQIVLGKLHHCLRQLPLNVIGVDLVSLFARWTSACRYRA